MSLNNILVVEDQETDRDILVRLLGRLGVRNRVDHVRDGHEAIRYLESKSPYTDRGKYPFPAIIFLDLNLPVISGWDVLDFVTGLGLKGQSKIFIYSEIENVDEVQRLYKGGADSFLRKPIREIDLADLIPSFPGPWEIEADDGTTKEGWTTHSS